ncbi:unnamed protein product [Protopolystoma xenopodis]|uniref:Uncharacterized protein n=1 Tax=Protopolystoma xenopodis TaxID=117903 RepID=A0A448WHW4_9PLAT|nr:unnamed protein product [Protopolystoma xenopodis]
MTEAENPETHKSSEFWCWGHSPWCPRCIRFYHTPSSTPTCKFRVSNHSAARHHSAHHLPSFSGHMRRRPNKGVYACDCVQLVHLLERQELEAHGGNRYGLLDVVLSFAHGSICGHAHKNRF